MKDGFPDVPDGLVEYVDYCGDAVGLGGIRHGGNEAVHLQPRREQPTDDSALIRTAARIRFYHCDPVTLTVSLTHCENLVQLGHSSRCVLKVTRYYTVIII